MYSNLNVRRENLRMSPESLVMMVTHDLKLLASILFLRLSDKANVQNQWDMYQPDTTGYLFIYLFLVTKLR